MNDKAIDDFHKSAVHEISVPKINFGQYDHYGEVFEPYQFEQPLVGSLADDTLGIYKDVQLGILLYAKGESIDAIWECID